MEWLLHAGGTIVQKQLNNESLRIDTGCIVAYAGQIDYSVEAAGGLKSMFFVAKGCSCNAAGHRNGVAAILCHSAAWPIVSANAPAAGGNAKGERSTLGQLGRMMDGDFRI